MVTALSILLVDKGLGDPPRIAAVRDRSAIAGLPFAIQGPRLAEGTTPVTWSLYELPPGMTINPETGAIVWSDPREGVYHLRFGATNVDGADYAEWILRVVPNDFPNPQMYSTRYVDFIAPTQYVEWMQTWNIAPYVDAYWERMREIVGQDAAEGRQIYRYNPALGGGAHSGNPAEAGPGWWTTDPVQGWSIAVWYHEIAHNFHGQTRIGNITGNNWADAFFHHGTELMDPAVTAHVLANPTRYGLSGLALSNFTAWVEATDASMQSRAQPYVAWLAGGGRAQNYSGDAYGAWGHVCRILRDTYGPDVLEDTVRAFRAEGLPQSIYSQANTPTRKNSLFFAILSVAAGEDLRAFFSNWGFDVDSAYFAQIYPLVQQAIAEMPRTEQVGAWKRNPANSHFYRLTDHPTSWMEARRSAARLGGELVTIRSAPEEQWLTSRFGTRDNFWCGLTDRAQEGQWQWASGESTTYANWGTGEPGGTYFENAALFYSPWNNFRWIDANENDRFWAVIETERPPCLADITGDGAVSLADLASLLSAFGTPSGAAHTEGDNDFDGDVDLADLAVLLAQFGEYCDGEN